MHIRAFMFIMFQFFNFDYTCCPYLQALFPVIQFVVCNKIMPKDLEKCLQTCLLTNPGLTCSLGNGSERGNPTWSWRELGTEHGFYNRTGRMCHGMLPQSAGTPPTQTFKQIRLPRNHDLKKSPAFLVRTSRVGIHAQCINQH
jgi:hypothetical protein